jgi:Fe-S cluster biogenesis protein NfuA
MSDLVAKAQAALRTGVAPALGLDPAELTAVAVENGILSLKVGPACLSCSGSVTALIASIEAELSARVPEIEIVELVG